jgi:uncharacterized protein (DUF1501 family)
MMKRSTFLKYSLSGLAVPFMFRGQMLKAYASQAELKMFGSFNPNRKIVLLQMDGGYDGLNVLIPISQYDNLYNARPNILINENQIIKLTDDAGIHPAMSSLSPLYSEGKLQLIQGVGYPNPNLSHFRSKDIVLSASDAQTVINSGWIGRLFEKNYPGFPQGYPNETNPHPIALAIGSTSSATCQGVSNNFSTVLQKLSLVYDAGENPGNLPDTPFGLEMAYISEMMQQTDVYLEAIKGASASGTNLSGLYPAAGTNSLADQLKIVASLIHGGLQTQFYIVSLGGWDTHSAQVVSSSDKLNGKQPELMQKLSTAIHAFQDDLRLMNKENEVLGMVYTEFGRRIKSNDSNGTDHGTTWPAILFGAEVNAGITGSNPVIGSNVTKNENLTMQYDFKSLYSSIFTQWFNVPVTDTSDVMGGVFPQIPILKTSSSNHPLSIDKQFQIYPNPARREVSLTINSIQGNFDIILIDNQGKMIASLYKGHSRGDNVKLQLDLPIASPGIYTLSIRNNKVQMSNQLLIIE